MQIFSDHLEGIVQKLSKGIPKALKSVAKFVGISKDHFIQHIVCPSCDSAFTSEFSYVMEHGERVPNKFPRVAMPNHPFHPKEGWSEDQYGIIFVIDGNSFLQSSYNLCLTMNVDWFQPFTHTRKLQ